MPRYEAAYLPLEILIKGSASNLIKGTCSINTIPDPVSPSPASTEQSSLNEYKEDAAYIKDSKQPSNNKLEPHIKNSRTASSISKQEVNNSLQRDKNNNYMGLMNEIKKLYFRRISVRTQQSVYIDGIVAEVGRDFIIMITPQLSVVTIPLSGIVSFNILNP